jgi:hypothetical protein
MSQKQKGERSTTQGSRVICATFCSSRAIVSGRKEEENGGLEFEPIPRKRPIFLPRNRNFRVSTTHGLSDDSKCAAWRIDIYID